MQHTLATAQLFLRTKGNNWGRRAGLRCHWLLVQDWTVVGGGRVGQALADMGENDVSCILLELSCFLVNAHN